MEYEYYVNQYRGSGIDRAAWPALARRAKDYIAWLRRHCRVSGDETMAVCAVAEELARFDAARSGAGGLSHVKIGEVSVSGGYQSLDISPEAEQRALYRAAERHLTIYRGVG